jgi:branched-chain amino acid transport system ATP-binding protein
VLPLVVLAWLQFMDQANQSAFNILLPNIRDAFHLSDAGILAISAIASAAALLATLPVAMLADRVNRVWLALVGAVVWSCFSVGLGLAGSAVIGGIMLSASTMGQSVVFPTHNSLLADYYPVEARPRVYSLHRAGLALGAVFGVLVGAGLETVWSWRAPFLVFPVLTVAGAIVGTRLREPRRGVYEQEALGGGEIALPAETESSPSLGEAWRLVWKIQALRRIFLALPFLAAAIVGFTSLASLQYQRTFHLDAFHRAIIVAPVQVFDLIGLVIGARIGTRLANKSLHLIFRMLAIASVAASGFSVLFALAPSVAWAFVANAGIDASLAIVGPGVLAALSLAIPARARALGFSIGALFVLPGLVIVPIVGAVGDAVGLRYGMLVLVPVFVLGGLVVSTAGSVIEDDVKNVWTSMHARAEMRLARLAGKLPLLALRDVKVAYGSVTIIEHLDFELSEGEIVAVLGTNGAGKSTLLRAIGGVLEADSGAIIFDGQDITHVPPEEIARLGISQMPGGEGVFPTLTVEENLRAASWQDRKQAAVAEAALAKAFERFPTLAERRRSPAGDLSGGQQQMLAVAMAFLRRPRMLLVDELSLGLAPIVVEQLMAALRELRSTGTSVVVVEQSANIALAVADRAYVMEKGAIVFEGPASDLAANPEVLRSVYLHGRDTGGADRSPTLAPAPARARPAGAGTAVAGSAAGPAALRISEVSVAFGGIVALHEASIEAIDGEVLGIIGPNGAGKTTLFDIVSGYTRPGSGRIALRGRDITRWSAPARACAGLGRSFQDSRLFGDLTVTETLALALERFIDARDPLGAVLRLPAYELTEAAVARRVDELVESFHLEPFTDRLVRELSTGTRRLVDLAGIVAHSPSVILLDEPSSGLAQREVEELARVLDSLRARLSATLVIVEHDIAFIRGFADRLVAMDEGEVIATGSPSIVLDDPGVVAAFLGFDVVARQRSGTVAFHADDRSATMTSEGET